MSKIFEFENQFILRLPESLAEKVNTILENPQECHKKSLELQPFIEKTEENGVIVENLRFKH